ncbi:molybdenum ABC transporter substrate-binding protein [Photobacterium kishitanii]|nr:molybdenum ABC transporter substrate-binding protein [Photobacterium kishitanii]KJG59968.1 molybdenum ABC transporter substrate-binding protein [Photobacterium kishitanii]KJG63250.1 molybdenum ABC transporter substrate-binding protein [Photobacterium kishitanii]KJG67743.1 molybdenum ABC transporter substrate-binding protein [Photobacterium kishitanii]KJG71422.1 molybdenum ABC transporter substrate-binding protein [Photobacterium kishitanii]
MESAMSFKSVVITAAVLSLFAQPALAAEKVTVFAASSLTNALNAIAAKYQQQTGVETTLSFASSSALARQVSQGAPANIYLSANEKWMDYAQQQGAIAANTRKDIVKNSLVMVAPLSYPQNKVKVSASWDLAKALDGTRLAVGDPNYVPAGIYAKQALEYLGLWKQAQPLLASANNVRSALVLVERGEAQLGIVYKTDAEISKKVKTVYQFPADSHKPIVYPMALVKGNVTPAAKGFYQYLQQPQAAAIFKSYGFDQVTK